MVGPAELIPGLLGFLGSAVGLEGFSASAPWGADGPGVAGAAAGPLYVSIGLRSACGATSSSCGGSPTEGLWFGMASCIDPSPATAMTGLSSTPGLKLGHLVGRIS